jgi:hypothetical protein
VKRQSALGSLMRWSALALLFGTNCHDYARFEHQPPPSSDGGVDNAGAPGSTQGGSLHTDSGGAGGAGSDAVDDPRWAGQAGQPPLGNEAGSGGEGGAPSPPSMFGTVWINAGGKACAGSLQTNAWVLTAGHCIPPNVQPADISVALGSERDNPNQTTSVHEIARFGTPAQFQDLALLRLETPFTLNGSATGYRRSFYPGPTGALNGAALLCLGWDLSLDSGESRWTQSEVLKIEDIETASTPTGVSGVTLWLQNGLEGSNLGGITQAADEGGGCFVGVGETWQQVAVQLENSSTDPHGIPSNGRWARAASLTDSDTRHWMLRTMLGQAPLPGVTESRGLSATLGEDGAIVLLWTTPMGSIMRASLKDPTDSEDLGRPEGVTFVEQRPGATLYGDQMLVVGYGNDGQLWYRLLDGDTASSWAIAVGSAQGPTSGAALVNVAGTVHLFALGADAELRRATFAGAWHLWEYLNGNCNGAPSASSWGPNRIDVVARCSDGALWHTSWDHIEWLDWASWGPTSAEPLVINPVRYDSTLFGRSGEGNLLVRWYYWAGLSEWVDLGVPTGKYMTAVSRMPGTYDLFLSDGDSVTHVWWPR